MKTNQSILNKNSGLKNIFRALGYRNFRLFFFGQTVSLTGTWMQNIALGWLVYRITNSAFWLGIVVFIVQIPSFLLSPFAGVFVDRWNRHRIIIVAQILAMFQALVLAYLIFSGHIAIWHIIILGGFLGLIGSIEIPARHALIIDMIEKKQDLSNAIALNSLMFNLARLIGPSIAGFVIYKFGEGICFLLNGISYIAVIAALFMMRIEIKLNHDKNSHPLKELKEGFIYTFGFAPIRSILLLVGLMSLMGSSQSVLMPVFAKDILKGDSFIFGLMGGVLGSGALLGALYLASSSKPVKIGRLIPLSAIIFGFMIMLFGLSKTLWFSLCALFLAGFFIMVVMVSANTVLQTIIEDDKRGRVMSFYTMAFMGMSTFGSLFGGAVASKAGASLTVVIGGISCIIGGLILICHVSTLKNMTRASCQKVDLSLENS